MLWSARRGSTRFNHSRTLVGDGDVFTSSLIFNLTIIALCIIVYTECNSAVSTPVVGLSVHLPVQLKKKKVFFSEMVDSQCGARQVKAYIMSDLIKKFDLDATNDFMKIAIAIAGFYMGIFCCKFLILLFLNWRVLIIRACVHFFEVKINITGPCRCLVIINFIHN